LFLKFIIKNNILYFIIKYSYNIIIDIYNIIINIKKFFFNFKLIEYFLYIYNLIFFLKKKDLNYKYMEDPFMQRNKYIKLFTKIDIYIYFIIQTKFYIKSKNTLFFIKNKVFLLLI
jgi:hypothetical protein